MPSLDCFRSSDWVPKSNNIFASVPREKFVKKKQHGPFHNFSKGGGWFLNFLLILLSYLEEKKLYYATPPFCVQNLKYVQFTFTTIIFRGGGAGGRWFLHFLLDFLSLFRKIIVSWHPFLRASEQKYVQFTFTTIIFLNFLHDFLSLFKNVLWQPPSCAPQSQKYVQFTLQLELFSFDPTSHNKEYKKLKYTFIRQKGRMVQKSRNFVKNIL